MALQKFIRHHQKFDSPELKTMALKDGRRVVMPAGFVPGAPVLLVGDTGDTPLPVGKYELSTGQKFEVVVPGILANIVDDVKAGKMSFQLETKLRKEKSLRFLAIQIAKLKNKK